MWGPKRTQHSQLIKRIDNLDQCMQLLLLLMILATLLRSGKIEHCIKYFLGNQLRKSVNADICEKKGCSHFLFLCERLKINRKTIFIPNFCNPIFSPIDDAHAREEVQLARWVNARIFTPTLLPNSMVPEGVCIIAKVQGVL